MLERASHSADTSNDRILPPNPDQTFSATPTGPTHIELPSPMADMDRAEEVAITLGGVDANSIKTGQSQPINIDPVIVTDDVEEPGTTLGNVVNNSITPTFSPADDEDPDIDNDRGTDIDPNYTAAVQPGDTDRRATRATRDPAIPHCSLLVQVVMHVGAQSASI